MELRGRLGREIKRLEAIGHQPLEEEDVNGKYIQIGRAEMAAEMAARLDTILALTDLGRKL